MAPSNKIALFRPAAKHLAAALFLFALATPALPAQGCSQCRETIGQTRPQTQQAYRRGIAVLMVAGTAVFAAAILAVRRFR